MERGTQLVRTDDSVSGKVKFFNRRETDVKKAYVSEIDIRAMAETAIEAVLADPEVTEPDAALHAMVERLGPVIRLAVHGATQAVLDCSNKLDGQARLDYISKMCDVVEKGGWPSAPVDEGAMRQKQIDTFVKMGLTRDAATAAVDAALAQVNGAAE